jgi:hypothetical protein
VKCIWLVQERVVGAAGEGLERSATRHVGVRARALRAIERDGARGRREAGGVCGVEHLETAPDRIETSIRELPGTPDRARCHLGVASAGLIEQRSRQIGGRDAAAQYALQIGYELIGQTIHAHDHYVVRVSGRVTGPDAADDSKHQRPQ